MRILIPVYSRISIHCHTLFLAFGNRTKKNA
uniref:Uncharacterized protein n=1 Tax=Anguilla anguilla TaxID=7936 RepID=A0A0E9UGH8_ANGAN